MEKKVSNLTTGSAGVGGAVGVVAVFILSQVGVEMGAEEAAMLTAALGTIFAWVVRFLPKPGV